MWLLPWFLGSYFLFVLNDRVCISENLPLKTQIPTQRECIDLFFDFFFPSLKSFLKKNKNTSKTWLLGISESKHFKQTPCSLGKLISLLKIKYSSLCHSSVGKEFAHNAGDPGSIPGLGRSGEGIGYPLQYSWASLVAQLVKNLPAMWETWVRFLGWEDPLKKGKATHSSILAWTIPRTVFHGVPWGCRVGNTERPSLCVCGSCHLISLEFILLVNSFTFQAWNIPG